MQLGYAQFKNISDVLIIFLGYTVGSDLHPLAALPPNVKASLNIQEDIPSVPPTIVPAASKEHNWPRTRIGQPKGNFHQEGLTSSSPFLPSAPGNLWINIYCCR